MDLLPLIPDNITEVLVKIVQFTELRRGTLSGNIRGLHTPGYVPRDLPVAEFAELLHVAIGEHVQHRRLLFRDTTNIKFGGGGSMRVHPLTDEYARTLIQMEPDEYLNLQISRLVENSLNWKAAQGLLQQHVGTPFGLPPMNQHTAVVTDVATDDQPSRPTATD
jgi:flagellar basal body rod protein FlgB